MVVRGEEVLAEEGREQRLNSSPSIDHLVCLAGRSQVPDLEDGGEQVTPELKFRPTLIITTAWNGGLCSLNPCIEGGYFQPPFWVPRTEVHRLVPNCTASKWQTRTGDEIPTQGRFSLHTALQSVAALLSKGLTHSG